MERWPHQISGVRDVLDAFHHGSRAVLLTTPTGGGKTVMMADVIEHFLAGGGQAVLYTDRNLLRAQLSRVMADLGLPHGIRAAGHGRTESPFQISSIQTEASRVLKRQTWHLHEASLAVIDEAHKQKEATAKKIIAAHLEQGAYVLGVTATPLDLEGVYDTLIQAGGMGQLRECGALVFARHFACDEPAQKLIGYVAPGQALSQQQQSRAMMTATVYARVLGEFERLNPGHLPTVLFAPGVAESLYFAERFQARGIPAGHISGQEVWIRGKKYQNTEEARGELLGRSQDGSVSVLCNRFVLREGVDCPWLQHGILATVFGDLTTYLQAGGRLLRAHPGVSQVTVQDHGGNWWRHGSLNGERTWRLGDTCRGLAQLRADRLREKKCQRCQAPLRGARECPACGAPNEREPRACPRCRAVLNGSRCACGYELQPRERVRAVIEIDGRLVEQQGDIFRSRVRSSRPDTQELWKRMYFRARNTRMTFFQAEALFFQENDYWPPRTLPFMPKKADAWERCVKDLNRDELL